MTEMQLLNLIFTSMDPSHAGTDPDPDLQPLIITSI
jgi:hypothetical protein